MGFISDIFFAPEGRAAGRRAAAKVDTERKAADQAAGVYHPDGWYLEGLPAQDTMRKGNMDEYCEGTAPQLVNALYTSRDGIKNLQGGMSDMKNAVRDIQDQLCLLQGQYGDLQDQYSTLQRQYSNLLQALDQINNKIR